MSVTSRACAPGQPVRCLAKPRCRAFDGGAARRGARAGAGPEALRPLAARLDADDRRRSAGGAGKGLEDQAIAFARRARSRLAGRHGAHFGAADDRQPLSPRALATLREAWPDIDLELIGESRDADLAHGEADLRCAWRAPPRPGWRRARWAGMGSGCMRRRPMPSGRRRSGSFLATIAASGRSRSTPGWRASRTAGASCCAATTPVLYQACRAGLGIAPLLPISARSDCAGRRALRQCAAAALAVAGGAPRCAPLAAGTGGRRQPAEIIAAAAAVLDPQGPGS